MPPAPGPSDTVELAYHVTLDDIHAFNLHYARTSPQSLRSRRSVRFALTFLLGALLCSLGVLSKAPLPFWLMGFLILGGWWAMFPRRLEQMLRRYTERLYASGKNAGVLGPHRLSAGPEWLSESTDVREVRTHWRAVERVEDAGEHLFLYVTAFSAVIVPKRAFATPADAEAFARLAEERRRAHSGSPENRLGI